MEDYDKIKKVLALGLMHFLDENRPEGKMCLSNGECADIEKAFNEQDWSKLARCIDKYLIDGGSSKTPNDLEETAKSIFPDPDVKKGTSVFANDEWSEVEKLRKAFILGVQWGAEHRGSSEIPTDLESYAQKVEDYYDVGEERGYLCVHRGGVKEAVIAGAKWHAEQILKSPLVSVNNTASEELQRINYENGKKDMKEQMMKGAVEGTVYANTTARWVEADVLRKDGFICGDKVKIIIVKED